MHQKIELIGNLGRDVDMRFTSSGVAVADFSMATNRKRTDGNDQKHEETIWWKVTFWRRQAEVCNEYLKRGSLVRVEGTMKVDPETGSPRIWTDKNGNPRVSLEITGHSMLMLGDRSGGGNSPRDEDVPPEITF